MKVKVRVQDQAKSSNKASGTMVHGILASQTPSPSLFPRPRARPRVEADVNVDVDVKVDARG